MIRNLTFGHQFHGWVKNDLLTMADGTTRAHVQPNNGWVTLFKKPGQPAYNSNDGLLDYALISGGNLLYGKELSLPLYGAESAANCWLMASDHGNWLVAAYPQSKKLYYRQFGDLSQTDAPIDGWLSLPGYPYVYDTIREASFDGSAILMFYGSSARTYIKATLVTDGWMMSLSSPVHLVPDDVPDMLLPQNFGNGGITTPGEYSYLKFMLYLGLNQMGVPMFAFIHGMVTADIDSQSGAIQIMNRQEWLKVAPDYVSGVTLIEGAPDELIGLGGAGNCAIYAGGGQYRLVTAGGVVAGLIDPQNLHASYQPMTGQSKVSNSGPVCWV